MMAKGKKLRPALRILILLLIVCGLLLADSRLRLVVTDYELSSDRLPAAFDGFTIVQLSDVHGAVFGKDNARLLAKVAAREPDLIALTGDLADKDTDLADIDTLLAGLTEIAPVYYVSGNHEWSEGLLDELDTLFGKYGVRYLRNEYLILEREGESIVLAGVEDPNGWKDMVQPEELAESLRREYPDSYAILLGHRNYWLEKYPELPVDLIFCGHAHGGIVRLPFLGGVLGTGFELFPDYVDGVFSGETYELVVSRGLGESVVPRFLNNPEIVAVTLRAE